MSHTTLIAAAELTELINESHNVKIFDCRAALGDPEHGAREFAAGHLPAAQYLSLDHDLAAEPGEGGRHPLPDRSALASRLAELGCDDSTQIVVYDDAGGAFAARAWWCIRWLGHEAVAVLDGGIAAWTGALETTPTKPAQGSFESRPPLTRTIEAAALAAHLGEATLIDARAQARFDGLEEPIDAVAGHIPGASCLPFQGNLDATGRFLPPAQLAERFADLAAADPLVCYCGSGVTAAHNILALRIAGFAEPILYPGSWSEWIRDEQRPIATGQSAAQ